MHERTDETPWCAVPLLDETAPTLWFKSDMDPQAQRLVSAGYTLQYRPRRRKVKPKTIKTD